LCAIKSSYTAAARDTWELSRLPARPRRDVHKHGATNERIRAPPDLTKMVKTRHPQITRPENVQQCTTLRTPGGPLVQQTAGQCQPRAKQLCGSQPGQYKASQAYRITYQHYVELLVCAFKLVCQQAPVRQAAPLELHGARNNWNVTRIV
jgi:hypothetical protein